VRLTRHAKNRLRYIARRWPGVSEEQLLANLAAAEGVDRDVKGNSRLSVEVGGILLIVIVDPGRDVVVTIWRQE
jgi:hypothetical protein